MTESDSKFIIYLIGNRYKISIVIVIVVLSIYFLFPRSMEGIYASQGVNIANLSNIEAIAIYASRERATYMLTEKSHIEDFMEVFEDKKWRKSIRYPNSVSGDHLGYYIIINTFEEEKEIPPAIFLFTPKYMSVDSKKFTIYGSGLDGSKIEELLSEIEPDDGSSK